MSYSSISIIGIMIGIIVNYDVLSNRINTADTHVKDVYRNFLVCVLFYYVTDALWGIFDSIGAVNLLYVDTTAYFFFMALSVLTWSKYVAVYLADERGFNTFLRYAGWIYMLFCCASIVINFFNPILFYFDAEGLYHAAGARDISFIMQIAVFLLTTIYTVMIAVRTEDRTAKLRYRAVWAFGVIMISAIVIQYFDPYLPVYAAGYIISTCMIHTFVHEDENEEHRRTLRDMLSFEQKQKEEIIEARNMAYTDSLTGVNNSHAYIEAEEEIDSVMAEGWMQDFGLIVFDINGLKYINDTRGHEAGDELIIDAANLISESFPGSPIYRIGGDEFVLFLEGENYKNRVSLLESFNEKIEENLKNDGVVIAAGMDVLTQGIDFSYHRLFDRADKKMYDRKLALKEKIYEAGGERVGYYETGVHPGTEYVTGGIVNDQLTGLPSMISFFRFAEVAEAEMRNRNKTPAVVFLDLSGLKHYNSKHGFEGGNKVLVSLANLISAKFGSNNCSRFSEDHFAVITDNGDLDSKLDDLIDEWKNVNDGNAPHLRIGICEVFDSDMEVSTACDRAKYTCDFYKNTSESYYRYFNEEMLTEFRNKQYILDNFETALEEKWIEVYYQPIIRTINGRVCEEECLSRWVDPVIGMLPPSQFVTILEDEGLIHKLDLYVLEEVLNKIKITREAGLSMVPQSINLSRKDFDSCDIISEICKRVDDAGIDHSYITIEITESTIGKEIEFMKDKIETFRKLGFRVWMDDFGSGYSSLDVLQRIEFDLIKFDRQFMHSFHEGDRSKIMLTELMRMATAIGVDTLCEGVETEEQLQFLREIGCSKVQGFYFLKPIPLKVLLERYEKGTQIGFEDPRDSEYLDAVGNISLHDLSFTVNQYKDDFEHYFSTLPMAIIENRDTKSRFVRYNQSLREFLKKTLDYEISGKYTEIDHMPDNRARRFMKTIVNYCGDENLVFVDERLPSGLIVNLLIRRIAENKRKSVKAYAIVVLAISGKNADTSYENIARSLAADYFKLYYVNLSNDEFIEYTSDVGEGDIFAERRGTDFFNVSVRDSNVLLYGPDRANFLEVFKKENILKAMDEQGSFNMDYRLVIDGKPVYVRMKVMRMEYDPEHIIIGVRNVDTQMRESKALDILRSERAAYNRINALLGDFVVMYSVDPRTGHYIETSSITDYEKLGISKEGNDFFTETIQNSEDTVHADDRELFKKEITKDNIIDTIKKEGRFTYKYRLLIDGEYHPVRLRATLLDEAEGEKLIIGVNYIN